MSCPAPDRVLDYLARRLDAHERAAIEAHVDRCTACRLLLAELARTDADELVAIDRDVEPARIGRYRVEAWLGDGGMGTVYAAYDPQLDRRVAVKLVHPELAVAGGVERLLREGRALARLSHPNVVAVHDSGADGDRVYIAMELVDGETLAAWLRGAARSWRTIVDNFVAAGRGLAAAHREGIIHRDVKPENVLIDRSGVVKVVDFGLAASTSQPSPSPSGADSASDRASRLTDPGALLGTPAFMSPEQRSGGDVGPATDQYSLCAALWAALFDDDPARRIPRWLRRALDRGLDADPAARFGSMDELVDALAPAARARRIRRIAVAAAAIACVVAFAATRGSTDETARACTRAADERAALWTIGDRAAIAGAFFTTGARYAGDSWTRLDAAALQYVREIATAATTLCDQRPQRDDARELQQLGLACVARRRVALAQLTEQLRRSGPTEVRLAVSMVHDLDPVEECASSAALADERAQRASPVLGVARLAVWAAIDESRRARATGDFVKAAASARRAIALARPLGGTLLAKAMLDALDPIMAVEGAGAGEAAAREAVIAAEAAQADELRALAMTTLMLSLAKEPGREREALAMRPLVEAAIARAGQRTASTPPMLQAVGIAYLRLGEFAEALTAFEAALAAARAVVPAGDPRLPDYIYPVGLALDFLRRDREAAQRFQEAVDAANVVWGENHPNAARYVINLATKHLSQGDCPRALAELAKTRSILGAVLPSDSPEQLQIMEMFGTCYYVMHRHADALREHTGRLHALEAAGRGHSVEVAAALVDIGDVYLDRPELDAAIASFSRAIDLLEDFVGKADARLASPLARLGDALERAGRTAQARATLERSLALFEAARAPATTVADAQFPLARILSTTDRARARTLADAARSGYATGPPVLAPRLAEVEAWLRARPQR